MAVSGLDLSSINEDQLVKAGEIALKERRFDMAVQMFDCAWTTGKTKDASKLREKTMLLLDLLVEARIGLLKFDKALKDAITMVRCDRTDARGYLRCGQLKRLQGCRQAALEFCAKGMQHVPTSHKLYKMLRTQHEQTARAITLSLPTDPISVLPPEILQMILSYFTYKDATLLLRVSKTWSKAVSGAHQTITSSLDFSQSTRSISRAAFRACLRRLTRSPSVLVAESLSRGATTDLFDRLPSWTLLTSLNLKKVNLDVSPLRWSKLKLKRIAIGEEQRVTVATVLKILRVCPQLEVACFESVRSAAAASIEDMLSQDGQRDFLNLERFSISGTPAPTTTVAGQPTALKWPAAFVQRLPNLKELTLCQLSLTGIIPSVFDFSGLAGLRSLVMSSVRLNDFPTLPLSLEVLRCADIRALSGHRTPWLSLLPTTSAPTEAQRLPRLRTIQFHRVNHGVTEVFGRLPVWPDKTSLAHLEVSEWSCSVAGVVDFLEAGKARGLKHLRLSFPDLGDDVLEIMIEHCPSIEVLHLVDSRVTGVFIKGLVEALGGQLKRITLEGAESKVSFDAVKWAQEKGVTMTWKNTTYPGVCQA